jgi:hypothetical protein
VNQDKEARSPSSYQQAKSSVQLSLAHQSPGISPGLFDWNLKIFNVDIKFPKLGIDTIDILWYNLSNLLRILI